MVAEVGLHVCAHYLPESGGWQALSAPSLQGWIPRVFPLLSFASLI